MQSKRYAKLDSDDVGRLRDLTKREIIALAVLKLCRNERTGRCDPSRATIARMSGLAAPHVSIAIAGLESKKWIVEGPDGFEFVTELVISKVTESVTPEAENVTELVTPPITESVTKITKSVKKITNSVISHNIVKQRINNEGTTADPKTPAGPAVELEPVERRIWRDGLDMLKRDGMAEGSARTFLGKLAKDYGKQSLAESIAVAQAENPAEMKSFLVATLKQRSTPVPGLYVGRSSVDDADPGVTGPRPLDPPPPDIPARDLEIWAGLRTAIGKQIPAEVFRTWFEPILFDGIRDRRILLRAETLNVDWVERYYSDMIDATLLAVGLESHSIAWQAVEDKAAA